ncbi:polysaccharide deacetylase [Arthrobacter sp. FB24]|uniref:polysaccharide deacetylase family protein n=1 Tax=Arthrobacter sp. (strain FB24) TaxID=290399 RepID=UPI0000526AC7|nr:polysaccharide deacetylase family protein [Arthrobacter sp. FB24]ABK02625.1 polysaccharide deacetylase [Arthrobacter sp. FB24]
MKLQTSWRLAWQVDFGPALKETRQRARTAVTVLGIVALAVTGLAAQAFPAQAAAPTVVSLTFDDGNADQMAAAQIMNNYGLDGTFYIPSGNINNAGYLTVSDLQGLAASGHEIGGHTVTHADLTTLPSDEVTRQVCNDRVNLTNWGFRVTSFAYPFSAVNSGAQTTVRDCGYNSARALGDIQSRFGCSGCAWAETVPPLNPFRTAALDQVDSPWTLADFQNSVTRAESVGGWVQFTFHHISSTPGPLSISPRLFTQFASWLKTRPATTTVKTVDQVIGGTVKPAVAGPAVPPPPTSGNLVKNPSLETLAGGVPQCWQAAGYGTNNRTFSTVSPGRTGSVAERLVVTGYVNGDARLLPSLDLGGCSPVATPGHTYNLGAWYKSTANTQFALYYRTGLGYWVYWTSSPWFGPATTFQRASWTTPALPSGASGISFGLNLFSNGTLITDDYEMTDTASSTPPPPPPPAGTNLVQNASLETAGAGSAPQCWQTAGYGSNTASFSTVSTARAGTKAERLVMSNYANGDAKLLQALDSGSCAPPAVAGHTYSLRAWYTSTTVTQFAVYYRNSAGAWVYWTSSPWFAAAGSYTQASFTTPALPSGATAISFGLNLFRNGTLITDDYAMYDTIGAPSL